MFSLALNTALGGGFRSVILNPLFQWQYLALLIANLASRVNVYCLSMISFFFFSFSGGYLLFP
jgi:hypothetical protein